MLLNQIGNSLRAQSHKLSYLPQKTNLVLKSSKKYSSSIRALSKDMSNKLEDIRGCRKAIRQLIKETSANSIILRLAFHDAGTFDKNVGTWPEQGGANGSIRFQAELDHVSNTGLVNAVNLLKPIKEKFPSVSYADIFQMAAVVGVKLAGGPFIPIRYGRVDIEDESQVPEQGNLPQFQGPFFDGSTTQAEHLRNIFYRMGLTDKDIVALSGAHTLGRAFKDRSNATDLDSTPYTENGPGNPGGQSWTVEWLTFNNQYFKDVKANSDPYLLVMSSDAVLFTDTEFKKYADIYAEDNDAFLKDYIESHIKLSELGAKWENEEPVPVDDDDDE